MIANLLKEVDDAYADKFFKAYDAHDFDTVIDLLEAKPEYIVCQIGSGSCLHFAVQVGATEYVKKLIAMGSNVNGVPHEGTPLSPLDCAISRDNLLIIKLLLENGADPNYRRIIIGAITGANNPNALEKLKLLDQYGVDLHKVYSYETAKPPFPINALSMAEMYGRTECVEYLRSRGCVMPPKSFEELSPPSNLREEVVEFFKKTIGVPKPFSLGEVVPTEPKISVHSIPAAKDRPYITLFTSGLSDYELNHDEGEEDFRFGEIYMQIPKGWNFTQLSDPLTGWPMLWLRKLARHVFKKKYGFGGPVTMISNGRPPETIAPNTDLCVLFLISDKEMTSKEGKLIKFYRAFPIYKEERDLAVKIGLEALMLKFEEHDIGFVMDIKRKNVAV